MNISDLIPHRAPMLLVDELIELNDTTIETRKTVRPDEFFVQGHYPDFQVVPGVITCEMMFQSGAALIANVMKDDAIDMAKYVPVISRSNNMRFKKLILPGDEIQLKVEISDKVGGAYYMKGKAFVSNKLAASVEFTCMMTPRPGTEALGAES